VIRDGRAEARSASIRHVGNPADTARFIRENTSLLAPPHVPEIRLYLADEAHDLWHRTEEELASTGLPPPFWAFAWAGGQALARYLLDNPECVRDRTILDFATGSGIVGIAARKAGAARVLATDVDPFAVEAARLNARANGVDLEISGEDVVGRDDGWDGVVAGDVFYDSGFAERLVPWFSALARRGAEILVGDPGRSYLPRARLSRLAEYTVPVTRALEDADVKRTVVWRFS
jgi:predicted nicotinamide N-methyase